MLNVVTTKRHYRPHGITGITVKFSPSPR